CPTRNPYRANDAVYRATNNPCPTLAAACCRARSRGRDNNPNGARPAAIAPDDTSTISRPGTLVRASTSTNASTRSASNPPDAVVNEEEPTLTTIRRAFSTSSRRVPVTPSLQGLSSQVSWLRSEV
ncbi:hypothetical protein ABH925_007307, partial [Streptacidiphilus sp. EB129]